MRYHSGFTLGSIRIHFQEAFQNWDPDPDTPVMMKEEKTARQKFRKKLDKVKLLLLFGNFFWEKVFSFGYFLVSCFWIRTFYVDLYPSLPIMRIRIPLLRGKQLKPMRSHCTLGSRYLLEVELDCFYLEQKLCFGLHPKIYFLFISTLIGKKNSSLTWNSFSIRVQYLSGAA